MKKYYSINELCRLTMVSVRTLHHYDEINILKPHHRTTKGHRRYSENDLLRLQQIVTLKFMGFSLVEIKKILQQKDFNFFDSLKIQEAALTEQIDQIKKITKLIHYLITQEEINEPIDWQTVIQIMTVLKHNKIDSQQWYEKYLTDSEQQQYNLIGMQPKGKWREFFEEVQCNLHTDPTGDTGIRLVKKCLTLAKESYGDNPEFILKLWEAFKAGIIPSQLTINKKVISYLSQAFNTLQGLGLKKSFL